MEDVSTWVIYLLGFAGVILLGLIGMSAGETAEGGNYTSSSSNSSSCFDDDDDYIINHATGAPMLGGISGQDSFGNNYGCSGSMFESSSCCKNSFDSCM
ncbi:MAG: hypothetical protein Alis3KO_05630 [Aliiglaciecola sp.]